MTRSRMCSSRLFPAPVDADWKAQLVPEFFYAAVYIINVEVNISCKNGLPR